MLVDGRHFPITRAPQNAGAATVQRLAGGRIVLDAGDGKDPIRIGRSDQQYQIDLSGQRYLFDRREMQRLTIATPAGTRGVELAPGVDLPVRVRGPDGREVTHGAQQLPGRAGTIRVFEGNRFRTIPNPSESSPVSGKNGWGSLGVLEAAMLPGLAGVAGRAHEKALGGAEWRDVSSFGPGAWSLDATAALLGGPVRC